MSVWRREAGGGGGGSDPGYRIKNKNPTQSCGEKANSLLVHEVEGCSADPLQ